MSPSDNFPFATPISCELKIFDANRKFRTQGVKPVKSLIAWNWRVASRVIWFAYMFVMHSTKQLVTFTRFRPNPPNSVFPSTHSIPLFDLAHISNPRLVFRIKSCQKCARNKIVTCVPSSPVVDFCDWHGETSREKAERDSATSRNEGSLVDKLQAHQRISYKVLSPARNSRSAT